MKHISNTKVLGIIAKKMIPAKSRIIVDATYANEHSHEAIKDLEPKNGSLRDKFELNCFECGEVEIKKLVCLSISRVNHSCIFNADHFYDEKFNVKILFILYFFDVIDVFYQILLKVSFL